MRARRLIDQMLKLNRRLKGLNDRIMDELNRPKPDDVRIQTLKRMRLQTKDEIASIGKKLCTSDRDQRPNIA